MEVKPGYKQTEVGVIPEEWKLTRFVSLGGVIDGDRGANYPSGRDFSSDGHCLFLNAGNVTKAGFRFSDCAFISREKDERLSKGKLQRDDIVLTTRGTVGNFAHFDSTVSFEHIRINSGMVILRNESAELDNAFLYALLQSHFLETQIERLTFGSAQPQLTVKGINEFWIVVPPPPEQRAIAEALSDVDGLLGGLDRLIAKKRDLKQAAMQQLLTGQTRLPGFHGEWEVKRLGDLFNFSGGYSASRDQLSTEGHCYLHYGDIHGSTKTCIDTDADFQNIPKLDIPLKRVSPASLLDDGDVVFVDASEDDAGTSKHVVVVNKSKKPFISGLHTIVAKSKTDELAHEFRRYCFQTPAIRQQFLFYSVGTKVSGISKSNIPKLTLLFPSVPEQTAIASVLSEMDGELAVLEQRREKTRALKQAMMQELLTGRTRLV
jgi:type I restriction enzyme, S subunit